MNDMQRANMWKRIAAFVLDIILLATLAVGFSVAVSAIAGYDRTQARLNDYYAQYEQTWNITFDLSQEEYEALSEEEAERYAAAYQALISDEEAMYTYNLVVNLTLVITSLGIFFAFLALEFAVPLFFGNGQTVGKKIFGVCVMYVNSVKITPPGLFIRSVLGKYTIETMIPVLIMLMIYFNTIGVLGMGILGLILLLQIILLVATRNRTPIHDLLANTVVVDMASQRIFASEAEMLEYRKKIHAEAVAKEPY